MTPYYILAFIWWLLSIAAFTTAFSCVEVHPEHFPIFFGLAAACLMMTYVTLNFGKRCRR